MKSKDKLISKWVDEQFTAEIVEYISPSLGILFTAVMSHDGIYTEDSLEKVEKYLADKGYAKVE